MVIPNSVRRIVVPVVSIGLALLLLNGACSRDEEPSPTLQAPKVVKPIVRVPVSMEKNTPPNNKTLSPKSEEKMVEEAGPAAFEEEKLETLEIASRVAPPKEETGYYVVREEDTLYGIAGGEDVYGDPMMWPILGRHNLDKLSDMLVGKDSPDKALPIAMKLRIFTPEEVEENLEKRDNRPWVVNALSSPDKAMVVSAVVKLIREGFPVYITRAKVRGQDYIRVRIGFFEDKATADIEGRRIMDVLNLSDTWTFRAREEEFQAFGGY